MPITLITGTPGAGKTLLALQTFLNELGVTDHSSIEAIRSGLKNAKRPHAVVGVEGLQPGLFNEIDSPMDWRDQEDGTLFLVDEAWKWWGKHLAHIRTDPRYLELAEHRHYGYDFICTTQAPTQLNDHLKALAGPHYHVTRKFGTNTTVRYEWPAVQESPNSLTIKKQGIDAVWKHPKEIFGLYQSATQHTIKRKIPKKLLVIPVIILAVIVGVIFVGKRLSHIGDDVVPAASAAEGEHAAGIAPTPGVKEPMNAEEWAGRFSPRVPELPMSAPAYDDKPVVAEPRIACMIGERVGCVCKTEQGTDWNMPVSRCRRVVKAGGFYDPFKAPENPRERPQESDEASQVVLPAPSTGIGNAGDLQAGYGQFRSESIVVSPAAGF